MDLFQFKYIFKQRLNFIFGLVIFIFFILLIKFFYLQIIKFDNYAFLAKSNKIKIIAIPPIRGQILDRHGEILAANKLIQKIKKT